MITVEVLVRLSVDHLNHAAAEQIAVDAIDQVLDDPLVTNYWVCAVEAKRRLQLVPTVAVRKGHSQVKVKRQVSKDLVIIEHEE